MKHPLKITRTRIAPTPSGYLHAGNIYSFLITQCVAREHSAKILLRIDDMDSERVNTDFVADIFACLSFMEIKWDEGPRNIQEVKNFSQASRQHLYTHALETLIEKQLIFACNCSRSQILQQSASGIYQGSCLHKKIPLNTPGVAWRLNTSEHINLQLHDLDGGMEQATLPEHMQFFIVRRKEGYPAYQLCSLVDDVHFNVDLIVRGEDLYHSTLAQLYLACKLGYRNFADTVFLHHGLICSADNKKLSKSAGDSSVRSLIQRGVQRAAILEDVLRNAPEADKKLLADTLRLIK